MKRFFIFILIGGCVIGTSPFVWAQQEGHLSLTSLSEGLGQVLMDQELREQLREYLDYGALSGKPLSYYVSAHYSQQGGGEDGPENSLESRSVFMFTFYPRALEEQIASGKEGGESLPYVWFGVLFKRESIYHPFRFLGVGPPNWGALHPSMLTFLMEQKLSAEFMDMILDPRLDVLFKEAQEEIGARTPPSIYVIERTVYPSTYQKHGWEIGYRFYIGPQKSVDDSRTIEISVVLGAENQSGVRSIMDAAKLRPRSLFTGGLGGSLLRASKQLKALARPKGKIPFQIDAVAAMLSKAFIRRTELFKEQPPHEVFMATARQFRFPDQALSILDGPEFLAEFDALDMRYLEVGELKEIILRQFERSFDRVIK